MGYIPSNMESIINLKINPIQIEIKKIKKVSYENISKLFNKLNEVIKKVEILEKENKLIKETIKNNQKKENILIKEKVKNNQEKENILIKEKIQNSQKKENNLIEEKNKNNKEKENNIIKEKKNNIDLNKNNNLIEFIKLYEREKLGFNFYEPYEVNNENQIIIEKIKDTVYENYLPEKENCEYETAGNFLYSVGGISRQSLCIANNAFSELFSEYKKYLENNNEWLTFNQEEDRRKLSIWVKKCLDEKKFYEYYSKLNENKINKYLYSNEERKNQILLELFRDLNKLYTKCLLSYPTVEVNFTNNNCKFENRTMFDIIIKGKKKLVNFCYLPALKSNGKLMKECYYYVFTSIENKTYQIKENLFDDKIAVQNTRLYTIPNISEIKIYVKSNDCEKFKIKTLTTPKIPFELKPIYTFIAIIGKKRLKLYENNTGIFEIDEKYINEKFYINIEDYMKRNKDSKIYKFDQKTKNIIIFK